MYDSFDNTYQVKILISHALYMAHLIHKFVCTRAVVFLNVLQATIGIDFLSKTMYLEDRTVNMLYCKLSLALN